MRHTVPVVVMKGLFYHFSPGKDIGHGVHLFRLAESLKLAATTALKLTLLRDADAVYPPPADWKYGRVVPRRTLAAALRGRGPDFIVTAFFPFGRTACAGELLPLLKKAKKAGTRIYASVPLPYFSHRREDLKNLFSAAELYDRIFIHCPSGFDLKYMAAAIPFEKRITGGEFLEVFRALRDKLCFTGYVLPARARGASGDSMRNTVPVPGGGFILVHRGGGATSPEIVTCALLAKESLKSGLPMTVVAGPASSAAEMRFWRGLIKARKIKGVTLLKQTGDFLGLLGRSAVLAGTAGGTVYETLYLKKRAVLIPFTGSPGAEHSDQAARAAMLKELAGAAVLAHAVLTPESLARALDSALLGPEPDFEPAPELFEGGKVFAEKILEDAGER